jgi:hypothetical protein
MAESTYLPGKTCPKCNEPITGASAVFGEPVDPVSGDLSICAHCLTTLTYNDDLTSRVLTPEEFLDLPDDSRLDLTRALGALIKVQQSGDT